MEATPSLLRDSSNPFVKKNRVQGASSETRRMEINIVEPLPRCLYNYGRHVWKLLKNCIQVAIQIILFRKDPPGTIKITIRNEKGYIQEIFKCSREKLETNPYFKGLINTPMQGAKKVRKDCFDLCDPNPSALAFFITHLGAPLSTSFDPSRVLHFLAVADFYQDSKLKEACEEILVNGLDGANYQDLYSLAQTYDLKKLKPLCREKILIEQTVAKHLCKVAKHKKKSKVINALGGLGLHTKEIVNVLKKAMDEDSLRGEAAVALAKIMEGEIATHLISCFKIELKNFDWQGNRGKNLFLFCEALALTHDPAAQDFLLSLSKDERSGCCEAAKTSLIKYSNSAKNRFLLKKFDNHLSLEERKAIISKTNSESLHETIATLTNTGIREDLREAAAKKLAEIGSEDAFHALVDTIDNKSNEREFREKLVDILSDMQGSYKFLAAQHIVYQAIQQFDSLGGDYSQAFFTKLEDKFCYDPILRQGFIEAILLYMNMPKGHEFQALKTCFNKRRNGSDPFSRTLPVVLAMTYKDQALPVLVEKWSFEKAYRIPEKISEGLGIIGSDAAVHVLGKKNKYKDYLVEALGKTKNPLAYTYLTQGLKVKKLEHSGCIMEAMINLIGAGAFPTEEIKTELLDTLVKLIEAPNMTSKSLPKLLFLCRFIGGKELSKWMPKENEMIAIPHLCNALYQLSYIAPDMLTESEIKVVCQHFDERQFIREYQNYTNFLSNIAFCYPEEVTRKLTQLLSQSETIEQARYIIKALSAILPDDEKLEVEMKQIRWD